MLNKLKPKSEFSRNVLTLMTGTTIAQAIPIAISPILTRIYTPEDFGVFALYMSIASIVAVVATGRYELAIILPKKDDNAINIVALSIIIAFFVSFITLIIVFLFNSQITHLLGNEEISHWLYLIPLTVLFTGLYQSLNYWSNRKKQYKRLATSRIVQSIGIATTSLGMGFGGGGGGGLILGTITGQGLATGILGKMIWKEDHNLFKKINKLKMFSVAKRYIKFPKYLIIAHGMNTTSGQMPIILLSSFFNASVVGFFMLTQRVIGLPMSIVARAIGDVFRQKASYEYAHNGECKETFLSSFRKLLLISIVPFPIFYFIAPDLFALFFGKEWRVAGEYAQILTPMFFLQFISNPLSNMFLIAEKQQLDLYWQFFLLISVVGSLYLAKYLYNDVHHTLIFLTVVYSVMYSINLIMTYQFSKGNK